VGSGTAATLILLFSVVVPVAKAGLVVAALLMREPAMRRQTLGFVEIIAKWSMADVFAVAVVIAYLAAQASAAPPGSAQPTPVAFSAAFGPGFYWFAAYCLVSLAVHQATARRWLAG
jgi:paraquat-inducible protein A